MSCAILVVEDEITLSGNIKTYLERYQCDVRVANTGEEGLKQFESFKPDVVLLDYQLPGINGIEVLSRLKGMDPDIKVIMMTAHGSVQVAVDAMKIGAYDYLSKPLVLAELKLLLEKAVDQTRMEGALSYYKKKEAGGSSLSSLIGESPPMLSLKEQIWQLVQMEAALPESEPGPAVLITGETGTGKELVARALHFNGIRKDRPFIEINCAAIPNNLIESELFGYERGAFTDAKEKKLGLFAAAEGGTIFLDEIAEVDISLQAKLLKALEDRIIRRLGSLRDQKINVRIITATNKNLEELVREEKFRSDLYFRLRIVNLLLPPLHDREKDILRLANHFLSIHCRRYGKKEMAFNEEAEELLLNYSWPGNVRELRNMMEQTVLLCSKDVIGPDQLALTTGLSRSKAEVTADGGRGARILLPPQGVSLDEVERDLMVQALEQASWNITRAAKLLGLSRDTLRYRMEKHKMEHKA